MGNGCSFGWPVYSVFDEVKSFDGEIETGFYHINTNNFFPFKDKFLYLHGHQIFLFDVYMYYQVPYL